MSDEPSVTASVDDAIENILQECPTKSVHFIDVTSSSEEEIISCQRSTSLAKDSCSHLKQQRRRRSSAVYLMLKDVRYYFHHPYSRVFTATVVILCNFLFSGQDPTAHSVVKTDLPIVGNAFNFIFLQYPSGGWAVLKSAMWLISVIFGILFGKYIIHKLVFNHFLRLHMFSENKGSYMTSFICVMFSLFSFSFLYDELLLLGGESNQPYVIDYQMNVEYKDYSEFTQTCTWFGDFITASMVADVMLQEKLYPVYFRRLRRWWVVRYHRIIVFWLLLILATVAAVGTVMFNDNHIVWDSLDIDSLINTEIWRGFLTAFILILDLSIVMQDWDFPLFVNPVEIKLPGLNVAHINFRIPIPKVHLNIHITGKWFNYGILFFVTILDINCWVTEILYRPLNYAQYTHPETFRIYSVKDNFSINTPLNATVLSFAFRNSTIDPLTGELYINGDELLSARYLGYDQYMELTALIPVVIMYGVFFSLIIVYGRYPNPTKENPHPNLVMKLHIRKSRRILVPKDLVVPVDSSTSYLMPTAN